MRVHVGTSGFSYPEWKGRFYPATIKPAEMLPFYAGRFATVEINNTFYRMPRAALLEEWAAQVPQGFTFGLKAPKRITHVERLGESAADAVAHFLRVARQLGPRLGPLLFQLPPYFRKDVALLESFLALLPPDVRVAFEFRSSSWLDEDVHASLRRHGVTLCIAETDDRDTPTMITTASWGYLRLRRREYDPAALADWVARLRGTEWSDAFVYFKHEDEARGPLFASAFREAAREAGLDV